MYENQLEDKFCDTLGEYFDKRPITLVFFSEANRVIVNRAVVRANAQMDYKIRIREYNFPTYVTKTVDVNLFLSPDTINSVIDTFSENKNGAYNGKRIYLWLTILNIDLILNNPQQKQRLYKFLANNDIDHVMVSVLQEKMYELVEVDEVIDFLSGEKFDGNKNLALT